MKYPSPLISGTIIKRYKRFLADIILEDGTEITAYVPNTGSMISCWEKGNQVKLSHHTSTKRKYAYTLELIYNSQTWININTSLSSLIVHEMLSQKMLPSLPDYDEIFLEQTYQDSRFDFLLTHSCNQYFLEVKSVTFAQEEKALFPDAVSLRARKHLKTLIELKEKGNHSVLLFLVQRNDVHSFSPAQNIDPIYAKDLAKAISIGVQVVAVQVLVSPEGITMQREIPIHL